MSKKDQFDENEFDDLQSNFDDINFDGPDIGNGRKPSGPTKKLATAAFNGAQKGLKSGLTVAIERSMPKTLTFKDDFINTAASLKSIKDDLQKDLGPTVTELKQVSRRLLPFTKRLMPERLYNTLDKKLAATNDAMERRMSQEEIVAKSRDAAITNSLDSIFEKQRSLSETEQDENRINRVVDLKIEDVRHKDKIALSAEISRNINIIQQFVTSPFQAYLKKNLELKYRHLFVAKDTLATAQLMAKVVETKLEEIKNNTALPDIQKQKLSESFKESMRGRFGDRMTERFDSFVKDYGTKFAGNFKSKISDQVVSMLNMMADAGNMYADSKEMEAEFGDKQPLSAKEAGIGVGARLAARFGTTKLGKFFRQNLSPYINDVEDITDTLQTRGTAKLNQWRDDNEGEGGWRGFIASMMPLFDKYSTIQTNLDVRGTEAAVFDFATRTSIIEVIPGYLSKIERHIHSMITGSEQEELVYDFRSRQFMANSKFMTKMKDRMFGTQDERNSNAAKATGIVRAGYARNSGASKLKNFDDYSKEIAKAIYNMTYHKLLISPDHFKAYVETGEPNSYMRKVLEDIEDKQTVASLIYNSIFQDGQVDGIGVSRLNNVITSMLNDDEYKRLMNVYANELGYTSRMHEFMEDTDTGRISRKALVNTYMDIDDKGFADQLSDVSQSEYDTLKKREEDKAELRAKDTVMGNVAKFLDKKYIDRNGQFMPDELLKAQVRTRSLQASDNKTKQANIATQYLMTQVASNQNSNIPFSEEAIELNKEFLNDTTDYRTKIVDSFSKTNNLLEKLVKVEPSDTKQEVYTEISTNIKSIAEINSSILTILSENNIGFNEMNQAKGSGKIGTFLNNKMRGFGSLWETGMQMGSSSVESFMKGAGSLLPFIGSMFKGGTTGLLDLGLDSMTKTANAVKDIIMPGHRKARLREGIDKLLGGIDAIYTSASDDIGIPKISLDMFKKGVVDSAGNRIMKLKDIKGPLFDMETGKLLLSMDEYMNGVFVNSGGKFIDISGSFDELTKKSKEKTASLFSGGKKMAGNLIKSLTGGGIGFGGILGRAVDGSVDIAKEMIKGISGLFGRGVDATGLGGSKKKTNDQLDQIIKIITEINERQRTKDRGVFGDTDGDGIREGSFEDQLKDRQKRRDSKETIRNKKTMGGIKRGIVGMLPSVTGSSNKKSEDKKESGGFFSGLLGHAATAAAGTAIAGTSVGTAVTGAVTGIGASITGLAGSAGAAAMAGLAAIPVAGWAALGVIAAGAAGYGIYKWMTNVSDQEKLLGETRMTAYGFPSMEKMKDVIDWEERVIEFFDGEEEPMSQDDFEDMADDLGFDTDDTNAMKYFVTWYKNRFIPILKMYYEILKRVPIKFGDEDDLSMEQCTDLAAYFTKTVQNHVTQTSTLIPTVASYKAAEAKKVKPKNIDKPQQSTEPKTIDKKPTVQYHRKISSPVKRTDPTKPPKGSTGGIDIRNADFTSATPNDNKEFNGDFASLMELTKQWIKGQEGLSLHNYLDSRGLPTIGYGHLNTTDGYTSITKPQADQLFDYDFYQHYKEAETIPEFAALDPVRKAAMLNLVFNMGKNKVLGFKRTRSLLQNQQYDKASRELLNSNYAKQVGRRANEVSDVIASGDPNKIRPRSIQVLGQKDPIKQVPIPNISKNEQQVAIPDIPKIASADNMNNNKTSALSTQTQKQNAQYAEINDKKLKLMSDSHSEMQRLNANVEKLIHATNSGLAGVSDGIKAQTDGQKEVVEAVKNSSSDNITAIPMTAARKRANRNIPVNVYKTKA